MKKLRNILAILTFAICLVLVGVGENYAITLADLQANARQLTYGQSVAGSVIGNDDADYYKFTIADTGYFQLSVYPTANSNIDDIGWGWNVKIYSSTDIYNSIREYGSITSNMTTAKMALPKGDYYVVVTEQHSSFPTNGCEYAIKADYTVDSHWETESNNDNRVPTVIKVNEQYKGVHTVYEDQDWYKFTTTKDGKFSVTLSIDDATNVDAIGWGWNLAIYDSEFNEIKRYSSIDRATTTVELPFAKGTYYLKVEMQSTSFPCLDCVYGIKVNYKTPARWESEYNDENKYAEVINVNEVWNGSTYHTEDTDWYKVKTTKAGYFQVEFTVPFEVDSEKISWGWDVTIYDKNFNEIKEMSGVKSKVRTIILPYGKDTFYIKIEPQHSSFAPLDCDYSFQVINKAASNYESENNDIKKKADTLTLGKTYNGVTNHSEDEDWYKFKVAKNGAVKLELKKHSSASADDISWGWSYVIYDKNNNEVAEVSNIKSKGATTINLKKGTYYVQVETQHSSFAPTECRYTISTKFTQAPSATKITSIKSKAKKVTLKWKKSANATGYYVYRCESKNGEYKKIATVKGAKKTNYTDKKSLKKGKKYYYKIVAYKTVAKVTANANAGNIKFVKVK